MITFFDGNSLLCKTTLNEAESYSTTASHLVDCSSIYRDNVGRSRYIYVWLRIR